MTILIFYTMGKVDFHLIANGAKELIAILITIWLHWRFGNYLISIFAGTAVYMGLVQLL